MIGTCVVLLPMKVTGSLMVVPLVVEGLLDRFGGQSSFDGVYKLLVGSRVGYQRFGNDLPGGLKKGYRCRYHCAIHDYSSLTPTRYKAHDSSSAPAPLVSSRCHSRSMPSERRLC